MLTCMNTLSTKHTVSPNIYTQSSRLRIARSTRRQKVISRSDLPLLTSHLPPPQPPMGYVNREGRSRNSKIPIPHGCWKIGTTKWGGKTPPGAVGRPVHHLEDYKDRKSLFGSLLQGMCGWSRWSVLNLPGISVSETDEGNRVTHL